ncbi:hypothetical protein KGF57_001312 [Candida theae]|uniref:SAC3/GANP/THP3 conserved domain-containing protein n=1 Tax=Candida theae TaxID=1198502 RepID=A0AAD5BHG7_9ASCO|nr:uncharacterized protein KGF57_001312 [Candida theae]KAI5963367.1 hypothetical protein KGF57_001312 [Candida theae]
MSNYNEVQPTAFNSKNRGNKNNRKRGGSKRGAGKQGDGKRGSGNSGGHGFPPNQERSNRADGYNSAFGKGWGSGHHQNNSQNRSNNNNSFTNANSISIGDDFFANDAYAPESVIQRKEATEFQPTSYTQISRRDTRNSTASVPYNNGTERHLSNSTQRYTKGLGSPPSRRSWSDSDSGVTIFTKEAEPFHIPIDYSSDMPPFKQYVQRRLNDIAKLPISLREAAEEQLKEILRDAGNKKLSALNDWSKQKIPLLDGGGELVLQWELENGSSHGMNASGDTGLVSTNQMQINRSTTQTPEFSNNSISIQEGSARNEAFGNREPRSAQDITLLDAQSPTPEQKVSRGHIDLNSGEVPTSQYVSYSALNGKRIADDEYDSNERKRQRAERFQAANLSSTQRSSPLGEQNKGSGPIVGLNTNLEKSYLRLTSEPDPYRVRPQFILEKSVDYVFRKYESLQGKEAFNYINDQLKSIRQDLTVQHIKNDFAISVYEQNARVSLKHNDLGEFNQCLGQLKFLYNYKRHTSYGWQTRFVLSEVEMLCYKLIYMMITNNNSEISKIKLSLLQDYKGFKEKEDSDAIYFRFVNSLFKLNGYRITNNCFKFYEELGKYKGIAGTQLALQVIEFFLGNKVRLSGLYAISGSSRSGIKINSLQGILSFADQKDCEAFLSRLHLDTFVKKGEFQAFGAKGTVKNLYKKSLKVDIKGQI